MARRSHQRWFFIVNIKRDRYIRHEKAYTICLWTLGVLSVAAILTVVFTVSPDGVYPPAIVITHQQAIVLTITWFIAVIITMSAALWINGTGSSQESLLDEVMGDAELLKFCEQHDELLVKRREIKDGLPIISKTAVATGTSENSDFLRWKACVEDHLADIEEELESSLRCQANVLRSILLRYPGALHDSNKLMRFAGLSRDNEALT